MTCAKLSRNKEAFLLRYSDNGGNDIKGAHVTHVRGYRADVGIHSFILDKRGKKWFISEYCTGRRINRDRNGYPIDEKSAKEAFETLKSLYIGHFDLIETGLGISLNQCNQINF
jgi:hypothetical protein